MTGAANTLEVGDEGEGRIKPLSSCKLQQLSNVHY